MESTNHIFHILAALTKAKVEFILAGGVAIVLQGIERATMDIDIALQMAPDNVHRLLATMRSLGMVPRAPVPADSLADPNKVRMMVEEKKALVFTFIHPENPFQQLDIFLAPQLSYEQLSNGVEEAKLEELTIKLLSKKKLLEIKKKITPPRDKDLFDIQALEALLRKNELKK